jgi:hypothetical protein
MAHISNLEAQYELEADDDSEFEEGADEEYGVDEELDSGGGYAERFQELAMREFESDDELDSGIRDILGEMEQQYFLGGLLKKGLNFAKKTAGNLARKGLGQLARKLPIASIMKKASSFLGPNVTNWLTQQAAGLIPGGTAALSVLNGLGLNPTANQSETWERFAEVAQEIYEAAADYATEEMVDPIKAAQQAVNAIGSVVPQAVGSLVSRAGLGGVTGGIAGALSPADAARIGVAGARHGRRVVRLHPGQSVTIVCK